LSSILESITSLETRVWLDAAQTNRRVSLHARQQALILMKT